MSKIKRLTRLQHYKTGEIVDAPSITEFCKKVGLKENDKFHLTPVLDGVRSHHKGWTLPTQGLVLKDIRGNKYVVSNWLSFARKHHYSSTKIRDLVVGRIPHYKGLYKLGSEPPVVKPQVTRNYRLEKDGKSVATTNLAATARYLKVHRSSLYKASSGEMDHAQGWKFTDIIDVPIRRRVVER